MKTVILSTLLVFALLPFVTNAQHIISIFEPLKPAVTDSLRSPVRNAGIVDINSDLIIRIDRTELTRQIGRYLPGQQETWANLQELTAILRNQTQILTLFNKSLQQNGNTPDFALYDQLAQLQISFLDQIVGNDFLLQCYSEAEETYRMQLSTGSFRAEQLPEELFILQYFARKAQTLAEEANKEATEIFQSSDIQFLLAGYLLSKDGQRPIHVSKRVDTYEPEAYVVPRWVYTLSQENMEELTQAVAVAKTLEDAIQENKLEMKKVLQQVLRSTECLPQLKVAFNSARQQFPTLKTEIRQEVQDLIFEPYFHLEQSLQDVQALRGSEVGVPSFELLTGFGRNVQQTINSLEAFVQSYRTGFKSKLATIPDSVLHRLDLDDLSAMYHTCSQTVEKDIVNLRQIGQFFNSVLAPSEESAKMTTQISRKIRHLRPNEIPEQFTFRLSQTGRRANGDQIELVAFAKLPDAEEPLLLETRHFRLQQISLYSEAKVMVTLANPIGSDNINLKSEFQFAPSYSVLFRWGSRSSPMWNDFWNIGIGLNFAAPDFDLDGIPEFGAGLVVSTVKDFVSGGISYNFGVGSPYYFVGFRVPFTSTTLPILNSVEVESARY